MTFAVAGLVFLNAAVLLLLLPVDQARTVLASDLLQEARNIGVREEEIDLNRAILLRSAGLLFSAIFVAILVYAYGPLPGIFSLLPALVVYRLTRQSIRKIADLRTRHTRRSFPLFLSQIAILMRVSDFYRAVDATAETLDGPMKEEVTRLRDEMRYLPLRLALRNFARRIKTEPAERFVAAVQYGITIGADVTPLLLAAAEKEHEVYFNELRRRVRSIPVWLSFLPVVLSFIILLLLVYPLFMDIMTKISF